MARILVNKQRRKFVASTKVEALDRMHAWKASQGYVRKGEHLKTVGEVLGAWLHDLRLTGARESTVERCYGSKVRLHLLPSLGPVEIAKLDTERVLMALRGARRFKHSGREGDAPQETRQPLSPRSVQMCWVILKAACNWAVKEQKLPSNPLSGKRGPKVEKAVGATIRAWAPEHVQAFLASAKSAADEAATPEARRSYAVLHALWTLLITSGLRISEALGLEWGDLDATAGLLHVRAQLVTQKGTEAHRGPLKSSNSHRTIPLTAQALEALEGLRKGHPEASGWIFRTGMRTAYSPRNINRAWGKAVARTALPRIRLHDARHTAISLLLASGLDRYSVARHAGHTVATMEGTYAHVLQKQQQAVADVMTRLLQRTES